MMRVRKKCDDDLNRERVFMRQLYVLARPRQHHPVHLSDCDAHCIIAFNISGAMQVIRTAYVNITTP